MNPELSRLQQGDIVVHEPTGQRYYFRELPVQGRGIPSNFVMVSELGHSHSQRGLKMEEVAKAEPLPVGRNGYDFNEHVFPYLAGWKTWPVAKQVELDEALGGIVGCAGWQTRSGGDRFKRPWNAPAGDYGSRTDRCRSFLRCGQGGGLTGKAILLVSGRHGYVESTALQADVVAAARALVANPKAPAGDLAAAVLALDAAPKRWVGKTEAWEVAVCDHQVVTTSSHAQQQRGWHQAHCSKCGLDLSVDSSD